MVAPSCALFNFNCKNRNLLRPFTLMELIGRILCLGGLQLDFRREFFFLDAARVSRGACLLKLLSVTLGPVLAGFSGLDVANLAITANACGGPGIVLASVA